METKKTNKTEKANKMDITKETFHFQIKADDQPLANAEYWVVDRYEMMVAYQ